MQNRFKVFVADPIHATGMQQLAERFEVLQLPVDAPIHERNAAAVSADAIVVRLFRITPELLDQASKLKAVIKHGIGVDNIDIEACTKRGVLVANTPGGPNAYCVAEGAITLLLAAYRRVRERHNAVVEGRFLEARTAPITDTLWGKTVGILGFGQIGRYFAQLCSGFNCRILAYDPWAADELFEQAGVERVRQLDDILSRSDAISVHVPLTKDTHHLVGARQLALMKPTALIVNTARGGIIDEVALANALRTGQIAGAGIDVFEEEPPSISSPLLSAPNIVLSPHVAGSSEASLRELGEAVAATTALALDGKMPATTLNKQVWEQSAL